MSNTGGNGTTFISFSPENPKSLVLCKPQKYEFYIGHRDFTFPSPDEVPPNNSFPFEFYVGRRDFVFPPVLCNLEPDDLQLQEIGYGNEIEPVRLSIPIYIDVDFYQGNNLEPSDIDIPFPSIDGYFGEEVSIDLDTSFPLNINDIEYGNELSLDTSIIDIDLYYGDELSIDNLGESIFYIDADLYYGETLDVDFNKNLDLEVDTYYGNDVIATLGEIIFLDVDMYQGENLYWDESAFPAVDISQGYILGNEEDGLVPLHFSEHGVRTDINEIGTSVGLAPIILFEETPAQELKPEIMGFAYNWIAVQILGADSTHVWLPRECCTEYGDIGYNDLYWELNHEIDPNAEVYTNKGFSLEKSDLSVSYNLLLNEMAGGHVLEFSEDLRYDLSYVNIAYNTEVSVTLEQERKYNLCPPAEVIDGEDISVDMIDLYEYKCHADYMFYGNTMETDVQVSPNLVMDFRYGQQLEFEFDLVNIIVEVWYNAGCKIDMSFGDALASNSYYGNRLDAKLYEPTIDCYVGEELSVSMITEYNVEFIEEGCLENEYIYTNEDGVRLDYLTIRDIVEFLPYKHFIKARCY